MKTRYSLRYRIAGTIFVLEAVMMAIVLWQTLSLALDGARKQQLARDEATLSAAGEISRNALISEEYGELLPYVSALPQKGGVTHVLVTDKNDIVIASTEISELGQSKPPLVNSSNEYWQTRTIENYNEQLGTLAIKFSNAELIAATNHARNLGISIALSGMAFIAVVGLLMGYVLTRRLSVLTNAAQSFANGELLTKTGLRGHDEVAEVGKAFDRMADKVHKHFDELEQQVAKRTSELAVARDEALAASRMKSQFLANISHELRTPLNAIIGYSELIRDEAKEHSQTIYVDDSNKIRTAGLHLLSLINAILDLNKVESGKMEVYYEPVIVHELINDVSVTLKPLIEENHNRLTVDIEKNIGIFYCDITKIRQVLINVVGNAAKFTSNGQITINIIKQHDDIVFKIQDTGIGIAQADMGKLFNDFSQADASISRQYGGTGLGLSLSKRFCELLGGEIMVSSVLNQGSVFTIKIPTAMSQKISPQIANYG